MDMFERLNDFYSAHVVVDTGVLTSVDYRNQPGKGRIPPPATMVIDLGDFVSNHSREGMRMRVYSDFPFPNRKERGEGGPRDDFEREALHRLRENPDEPFYRFEDNAGKPILRYAVGRKMSQDCVDCHNSLPSSPKKDWKVGDVRGVFEITRPLGTADMAKPQSVLRDPLILIGGAFGALLVFSVLILILGRRARRPA
jgi:hypothetical protein